MFCIINLMALMQALEDSSRNADLHMNIEDSGLNVDLVLIRQQLF